MCLCWFFSFLFHSFLSIFPFTFHANHFALTARATLFLSSFSLHYCRGRSISSEHDNNSETEHSERSPLVSAKLDSLAKFLFSRSLLQEGTSAAKENDSPTRFLCPSYYSIPTATTTTTTTTTSSYYLLTSTTTTYCYTHVQLCPLPYHSYYYLSIITLLLVNVLYLHLSVHMHKVTHHTNTCSH